MSTKNRNTSTSNIKFLTPEENVELYKMVNADTSRLSVRNKAIFYLAKYCALRASEIGLISSSDYNPITGTIYCHRVKGSQSNTLQIVDPNVLSVLNQFYFSSLRHNLLTKNTKNTLCLFLSQKGNPLSRKMLDVLMKQYCLSTNIPVDKHHFHVLKHTRAMELIKYPEFKVRDIQWWLGHKNISNTMLYLAYTTDAMQHLFDALARYERERM